MVCMHQGSSARLQTMWEREDQLVTWVQGWVRIDWCVSMRGSGDMEMRWGMLLHSEGSGVDAGDGVMTLSR